MVTVDVRDNQANRDIYAADVLLNRNHVKDYTMDEQTLFALMGTCTRTDFGFQET